MVWTLALDDFTGHFCNKGRYPLLKAVNDELSRRSVSNTSVIQSPTLSGSALTAIQSPTLSGSTLTGIEPPYLTLTQQSASIPAVVSGAGIVGTPVWVPVSGTTGVVPVVDAPVVVNNIEESSLNVISASSNTGGGGGGIAVGTTVPPQAPSRSQRSSHLPVFVGNHIPSDFTNALSAHNFSDGQPSLPLNLVHDHPPEVVPIRAVVDHRPAIQHHGVAAGDLPVIPVGSLDPLDHHGIATLPHGPVAVVGGPPVIGVAGGVPDSNIEPVGALIPVSAIEAHPAVHTVDHTHGNLHLGRGQPVASALHARSDGISLDKVRPAPSSKPFLAISSNSSSSSSSSSSESSSSSRTIKIGGTGSSGLGALGPTLHDLLSQDASASASSSASSTGHAGKPPQAGHGTGASHGSADTASSSHGRSHGHAILDGPHGHHHPIKVIDNPRTFTVPAGSSVEAVIPIDSVANLADVLASLSSGTPSHGHHGTNHLQPGRIMQELDLNNILGGASPAMTTDPITPNLEMLGVDPFLMAPHPNPVPVVNTQPAVRSPDPHMLSDGLVNLNDLLQTFDVLSHSATGSGLPADHSFGPSGIQTLDASSLQQGLLGPSTRQDISSSTQRRQAFSPAAVVERQPAALDQEQARRELLLQQLLQERQDARRRAATQPAPTRTPPQGNCYKYTSIV